MAHLVVPKLGHIKIRYHRPLPDGKIKNLTIQRKASGWYANIAVEVADTPEVGVETTIGIDVGLESFVTTSDGDKITFAATQIPSFSARTCCIIMLDFLWGFS